jgi:hypothetical protein
MLLLGRLGQQEFFLRIVVRGVTAKAGKLFSHMIFIVFGLVTRATTRTYEERLGCGETKYPAGVAVAVGVRCPGPMTGFAATLSGCLVFQQFLVGRFGKGRVGIVMARLAGVSADVAGIRSFLLRPPLGERLCEQRRHHHRAEQYKAGMTGGPLHHHSIAIPEFARVSAHNSRVPGGYVPAQGNGRDHKPYASLHLTGSPLAGMLRDARAENATALYV